MNLGKGSPRNSKQFVGSFVAVTQPAGGGTMAAREGRRLRANRSVFLCSPARARARWGPTPCSVQDSLSYSHKYLQRDKLNFALITDGRPLQVQKLTG